MLKSRLLTACVLIPLTLALLFMAPSSLFYAVGLLLLLGSALEWAPLIPLQGRLPVLGLLLSVFLMLWASFQYPTALFNLGMFFWLGIMIAILTYPKSQTYWGNRSLVFLSAFILLPLCGQSLSELYGAADGPAHLLYLLLLVWSADTGAYAAGKLRGKHKLIPKVSPGKTIEGALGGLTATFIVALAGCYVFTPLSTAQWFMQALLVYLFALFGDLFVSMLKRRVNCKDTGQILPGHGGLLDRLDSLIAAAPVYLALGQF